MRMSNTNARHTFFTILAIFATCLTISTLVQAAPKPAGELKGTLTVGGVDAKLANVRARAVALDAKTSGYAVLLSARPAEGDIRTWRTADPKERGNFLYVIFDSKGEIWVYELSHASSKAQHFGGVSEIKKVSFQVKDRMLSAHIRTNGEQTFSEDRFTVDLTFSAPVEDK